LLAVLLLTDSILIGAHVWLWYTGQLGAVPQLNIEMQGSVPEYFNYLKWLTCSLACLWLFARRREPLYLAWGALFLYFLVDDAESIRDAAGAWIVSVMDWQPAFGEIAVSCIAGAILLTPIAFAYRRASIGTRAFSRLLFPWLIALVVFGVGVDMLHAMVDHRPTLSTFMGVVEDGGEMIVGSILTSLVCLQAFAVRRGKEVIALTSASQLQAALRQSGEAPAWQAHHASAEDPRD
jgi:hypothetical protein